MEVGAAFMAGVEEASTAEAGSVAEVGCTLAAEAGSAGDRIRRPLPATAVRVLPPLLLRAQGVGTRRGPAMAILDPAVISRAEISGLEIPPRRPLLPPTANGIHLAAHLEAVDLRAHNRKPDLQVTREASTSLAGIAERDLLARYVAFRVRVGISGRTLPPREMLSPGLNRFPLFTIRSAAHLLRVPGFGRTRRSLPLRVSLADRRSWAIEDFRVA